MERDEFFRCSRLWKNTHDPLWVWIVIATCARENIPMPRWVRAYLIVVAKGIRAAKGDRGRELRSILKFPPKKSGKRFHTYMKDEKFAAAFMREISAGESPGKARRKAAGGPVKADRDKELKAGLKAFFGLPALPRWDQRRQWKSIIGHFLFHNPAYLKRYPDLQTKFNEFDFRPREGG